MQSCIKKTLCVLLCCLFALSALSPAAFAADAYEPVEDGDFLHTEGDKILNADGEEVVLRGTNFGGWGIMEDWFCPFEDPAGEENAYDAIVERFGADAIELSVSNPAAESLEVVASHADILYDMTKEVVSAVKLPVLVKLSQNTTNISKVAKAVKAAGGSGVTAINTVRGILGVDIESARPSLSTYGGISGEYIRPLGLASVATIAQTVDIPICGVGGISSAKNALEYIMLGASAVQIGTDIMLNGRSSIRKIVQELEAWAQNHDIKNLSEVRGAALENLKAFDEMKFEPAVSRAGGVPCSEDCNLCVDVCMYGAISRRGRSIRIDRAKCTGCGLCVSICPAKKLELDL